MTTVTGIVGFACGIARGSCRFVVGIVGVVGGLSLIPRPLWRQLQGSWASRAGSQGRRVQICGRGRKGSLGVFEGGAQDRGREGRCVAIVTRIVGFRARDRAGSQAREATHMRLAKKFLGRSCRHGFNEIRPTV